MPFDQEMWVEPQPHPRSWMQVTAYVRPTHDNDLPSQIRRIIPR